MQGGLLLPQMGRVGGGRKNWGGVEGQICVIGCMLDWFWTVMSGYLVLMIIALLILVYLCVCYYNNGPVKIQQVRMALFHYRFR